MCMLLTVKDKYCGSSGSSIYNFIQNCTKCVT